MRILLLMIMMIFANTSFAGLYKWVDNEGNVHYSQKRPANSQYKRLKAPPPAPENSKPLYESTNSISTPSSVVASETAKNKKIRAQNCQKAKKNLKGYTLFRRIKDKDGNVKTLDDKARAAQIKNAEQAVSNFCD